MKTIIKTIILFTLFLSVDCIAQESHKPSNVQVLGDTKTRAGRRELKREKKQHHAMMVLASHNQRKSKWGRQYNNGLINSPKYDVARRNKHRNKDKSRQKENPQDIKQKEVEKSTDLADQSKIKG